MEKWKTSCSFWQSNLDCLAKIHNSELFHLMFLLPELLICSHKGICCSIIKFTHCSGSSKWARNLVGRRNSCLYWCSSQFSRKHQGMGSLSHTLYLCLNAHNSDSTLISHYQRKKDGLSVFACGVVCIPLLHLKISELDILFSNQSNDWRPLVLVCEL